MTSKTREATAFLQIEGRDVGPGNYDSGRTARVKRVTNKAPEVVEPGCIVVKVRLRIAREAWEPFAPEAVIDVPADLTRRPIEVEAVKP